MTKKTFQQYRQEELTLMATRARSESRRLNELMAVMATDTLAPRDHVLQLRAELAEHHQDHRFHFCETMGELVQASLEILPHTPPRLR